MTFKMNRILRNLFPLLAAMLASRDLPAQTNPAASAPPLPAHVFVVPNFHPASCGWLANWSVERNYCANSYLNHLDRVRDDANYNFALSECNNMLAIRNFQPARFAELQERVKAGRVELVNAFFLEPTINLSGGEALAKMGIEGLRWQQQVMGVRPRYCWAIDTCGVHAQMPQICDLLGLDAGRIKRGGRADLTLFDPYRAWIVDADTMVGKTKNTPFDGSPVQGRVLRTVVDGRLVFSRDD